jgi:hypothetical protein
MSSILNLTPSSTTLHHGLRKEACWYRQGYIKTPEANQKPRERIERTSPSQYYVSEVAVIDLIRELHTEEQPRQTSQNNNAALKIQARHPYLRKLAESVSVIYSRL